MNLFFPLWMTAMCVMAEIPQDDENPFIGALKHKHWRNTHGYAQVRPGAHLFYWLFYANGTRTEAHRKPLIIWIQGGPGLAASGVGNFAELGPFTMKLEPRNHTWVKNRNVLFIDHPVGTGFSYVTNSSLYATTDREVAMDLAKAIKIFLRRNKEFVQTPTYLFSQSYGGKICPRLAYYLHTAIERKSLKMNLKGIGIGSGWVNPKASTAMQPELLYLLGAIDRKLYKKAAKATRKLIRASEYLNYNDAYTVYSMLNEDGEINFNNVYATGPDRALDELEKVINKYVKPYLANVNQTINWQYTSYIVYQRLQESFFMPSVSFLEAILDTTKLKVAVYNGNLDVVTPLGGAVNWVHKMRWHGAAEFANAKRHLIRGSRNGYYKESKRLSFWWVFGAGHWVPEENPEAMSHILDYMTEDTTDFQGPS